MKLSRDDFDIFVAGGAAHFLRLQSMLPKLRPHGTVHLASITLNDEELSELSLLCDHIHRPQHDADGYRNFALFCTRDINRLSTRRYFIKLDADVRVQSDWFTYVERNLGKEPGMVLFGPRAGSRPIDVSMRGALVQKLIGREIEVTGALKVSGGFYVADGEFYRQYRRPMQLIHELTYCFRGRDRIRAGSEGESWQVHKSDDFEISGNVSSLQRYACEDVLRSLVVHAFGRRDQIRVIPDSTHSILI